MDPMNKSILCFVDDLYEDLELWYPKLRLEEAGYATCLAGLELKVFRGKNGFRSEQIDPLFRGRPLRGPRTLVSQAAPRRSRLRHLPGRARVEGLPREKWLPRRRRSAAQRNQERGLPRAARPRRVHAGQTAA